MIMHRWILTAALALPLVLGLALPASARAQALGIPMSADLRGEVAFPIGDFGDVASTGTGFSVGLSVGVLPGIGIYGNYTQIRFGGGWTGDDASDATDSGFAVGVSAALAGADAWVIPWAGAGVLFHDLEVRGSSQGVSTNMGFEVGGGVLIPVTGQLRFSPAVKYRHYGATIPAALPGGVTERDLTVQHLGLSLGLTLTF
jgi:hypothetical protein